MKPVLRLRIGRGSLEAKAVRGHRVVWVGQAVFEDPATLHEAIAQLSNEKSLPSGLRGIRAKLDSSLAQVRTLEGLPPVKDSALKSLVAQQAPRFFRKNGKPLVTDAVWITRAGGKGAVAQAAAVEEPWIEAIGAGAREAGLELEEVRPTGDGVAGRLSLLPYAERIRRRRSELLGLSRLAAFACTLWALAGVALLARLQRESDRIAAELADLKAPVVAVAAARRKLGDAARMVEAVERSDRERSAILRQLGAIAAALPDSAFLTSVAIQERGGSMSGLARQATGVVAALERDQAIAAPKLVGSIVGEVVSGREMERFTVSFVRGALP
jgi:hypothetical protein